MSGMRFSEQWLSEKLAETDEKGVRQHRIISEVGAGMAVKKERKQGKRVHKYNAKRKEVDGISFASSGEADRYSELKYMASLGIIEHEKEWLQVPFVVQGAAIDDEGQAIKEVKYVADFVYSVNGEVVVEDFKGAITKEFRWKYKKFRQRYPNLFLWVNRDKKAVFMSSMKGFYDEQFKQCK